MFRLTKIFLYCIAALLACACTRTDPEPNQADMPNPASVYCEEQGGEVEIRTDAEGGQFGVCIFEDRSECEEWAFYRGECQKNETGMPNPASVFCEEQGGKVEIRTDSEGGQFGVCIFEDGSECDEWAFFRNECQPGKQGDSSSTSSPSYTNETFGFSLDPSSEWGIDDKGDYLLLHRPDYTVFIGYQWANEEPKPFRTGMPQGDFVDGGTAMLLGQSIPKRILVWEGKNKVVDYGGRIKAGDLIFVFYLDGVETEDVSYNDIDLTPEIITEVDQIISSLKLTSGKTPTLEFNP